MPKDPQRELSAAFAAFTESLKAALTAEAQRSVDGAIERLSLTAGPFRVQDIELEVVIRNVSVTTQAAAESGAREARPAATKPAAKRRSAARRSGAKSGARTGTRGRGRPVGALRRAILEEFADADARLTLDDLRDRLAKRDVKSSDDNLHQQLRRLVTAGELSRVGRGVYAPGTAGPPWR
jgi:hypothetical protein